MANACINKEVCSGQGERRAHKFHEKESLQAFHRMDGEVVIYLPLYETNSCFFYIMGNGTIL